MPEPEVKEETKPEEPKVEKPIIPEHASLAIENSKRLDYLEAFVHFVHSSDIRKYDDMRRREDQDKAMFAERQRVAKKAAADKAERQRIKNAQRPGKVRLENP